MKSLIIGMGKSGKSAYKFLKAKGFDPTGVDGNIDLLNKLEQEDFKVSAHPQIEEFDQIVLSPGIPQTNEWIQKARLLGKEIVGEAELGLRDLKQTIVGITGTNGKTTVTLLIEHILKISGKKAISLGNIGTPLTDYCLKADSEEIVVAELSSYQLETLTSPVLDIGVVLNITPDHLDRYSSMEEYARAKSLIQNCLKAEGVLYVNAEILKDFGHLFKSKYVTFGSISGAFFWTDKQVVKKLERLEFLLPDIYLHMGMHESENILVAWAVCSQLGVNSALFLEALTTFKKPAHRIEFVKEMEGVSYFDDSKGTNIDATIKAVEAMVGAVILIAGGVDKGASYKSWVEKFGGKVRLVFALGQAAEKIQKELLPDITVHVVSSLEEAVIKAKKCARLGDSVLLSPGCSSFDMFRDYAHRGEEFKKYVQSLGEVDE